MMRDRIAEAIVRDDPATSRSDAERMATEFIELAEEAGYQLVSHAKYRQLVHDSNVLAALENFGVDNWEGWSDALRSMEVDR